MSLYLERLNPRSPGIVGRLAESSLALALQTLSELESAPESWRLPDAEARGYWRGVRDMSEQLARALESVRAELEREREREGQR